MSSPGIVQGSGRLARSPRTGCSTTEIATCTLWGRERYDTELQPGTVMCIEAFVGPKSGGEGVKLEQQVLVTETGNEPLSQYSLDLI